MKKKPQHIQVLEYLKTHDGITSKQAFDLFGIMQMPKRIWILKKLGYNIITVMRQGENRFGESVAFAEYHLASMK